MAGTTYSKFFWQDWIGDDELARWWVRPGDPYLARWSER